MRNCAASRPSSQIGRRPMPEFALFCVDLDVHELRRVALCELAGWAPDIAGEIRAREMLHTGLDQRQQALLEQMAGWNVDR